MIIPWRISRAELGPATTHAGTAGQIADYLEEIFVATGSRGGFMLGHSQCGPRDQLQSIVDLLVPELQRRGRFRTAYTAAPSRESCRLNGRSTQTRRASGRSLTRDRDRSLQKRSVSSDDVAVEKNELPRWMSGDGFRDAARGDRQ